jgi:hypothetical protein
MHVEVGAVSPAMAHAEFFAEFFAADGADRVCSQVQRPVRNRLARLHPRSPRAVDGGLVPTVHSVEVELELV